jgi:hypothetical protein
MSKVLNTIRKQRNEEAEQNHSRIGYYLVHHTGRYFISEKVNEPALNKLCNKVLSDTDYDYWIDYSMGLDVTGRVAWVNLDLTDKFI